VDIALPGTCVQHFVLTRLALGNPPVEWLAQRLRLFTAFCAPSVMAQTSSQFTWFLAVSPTLPRKFLDAALRAAPAARPVRIKGPTLYPNWSEVVGRFVRPGRLITTRLDSDDMINKGYVKQVQRLADSATGTFVIDFPQGYQLELPTLECRQHGAAQLGSSRPTPFLSLVEQAGPETAQMAYWRPHHHMGNVFPVLQVDGAMWVQVCHGLNMLNRPSRRGNRVEWRDIRSQFM